MDKEWFDLKIEDQQVGDSSWLWFGGWELRPDGAV